MEVTLDTIFQLFSASEKQRAENERLFNEKLERQRTEIEKQRAENERLFNEKLEKQRADSDAAFEKQRIEAEKQRIEAEKQRALTAKSLKDLGSRMGDLSDIFGLYAEAHTKERILKLFGKRGIELHELSMHYRKDDRKGGFLYEIDILLYDSQYAIVTEVKNKLKKDDVDGHLERMEICREFPPRGTEGKILLGAIAAMIVSTEVENYAKKKGLYLIKPSGKSVTIAKPPDFVHKEWKVADA